MCVCLYSSVFLSQVVPDICLPMVAPVKALDEMIINRDNNMNSVRLLSYIPKDAHALPKASLLFAPLSQRCKGEAKREIELPQRPGSVSSWVFSSMVLSLPTTTLTPTPAPFGGNVFSAC